MIDRIGNISLNYNFYKGEANYSDGDIEDEILNIVKGNIDLSTVLSSDTRWPILYHFSQLRENLLDWYDFKPDSTILEIGAGCGAMTGLFCQKARRVTAIELSKKRAEIAAYRHRDLINLDIIVGNFNDIELIEEFDYITLIGVLEYSKEFINGEEPFLSFLIKLKPNLKKNGTLIIAIENAFGLKYWAGANEDHTCNIFDSLEDYGNEAKAKTFGKYALTSLLNASGFKHVEFYYPMPDYKLPTQIFTDEIIPFIGELRANFPNYDQDRLRLFDEKRVMINIINNNKFDFFANSFLIFAKREDD